MAGDQSGVTPTPGMRLSTGDANERYADLIADARYVAREVSRGEVLSGPAFTAAQPAIQQLLAATFAADNGAPSAEQMVKLETALSALMATIAPVTVQSLKDTECAGTVPTFGAAVGWIRHIFMATPDDKASVADRFSNRFVFWTMIFLLIALFCTFGVDRLSAEFQKSYPLAAIAAKLLLPYSYGAVGACVFLLRSLHKTIYDRSFDRRRKPEYVNRVLLGTISGGTLGLFLANQNQGADAISQIGPAALGFLAGYNTDLLFTAMERISNAILPKVDPPPMPPPVPMTVTTGIKDGPQGSVNTPKKSPADPSKSATEPDPDGTQSIATNDPVAVVTPVAATGT